DRSLPSAGLGSLSHLLPPATAALTPAASQEVPFKESLTLVSSSGGVSTYKGHATHFGNVTAIVNPDLTFVKMAPNGDTASGYITPSSPTTGTLTFTGG